MSHKGPLSSWPWCYPRHGERACAEPIGGRGRRYLGCGTDALVTGWGVRAAHCEPAVCHRDSERLAGGRTTSTVSLCQLRWPWETAYSYLVNATCGRVDSGRSFLPRETSLLASSSVRTDQLDSRVIVSLVDAPTHHRSYRRPSKPARCPFTALRQTRLLPAAAQTPSQHIASASPLSHHTSSPQSFVSDFNRNSQIQRPISGTAKTVPVTSRAGCSSPAKRQSGTLPHLLICLDSESVHRLSRSVAMSATALSS
jgi:hypothetical protein